MDNYKEKYERARAKALKLREQNPFDTVGQMVEHIFPELAESEEEKIKKEIIAIFKGEISYTSEEDAKRYITWLEKQGEHQQLYIRFGDIPANEKSKIYSGEQEIGSENGVSVYPAFKSANGSIILGLNLPITKTTLHTQQHLLEYDNRPCYLVTGDYVGKDTDGQILISNVNIIEKIDNYRVKTEKQGKEEYALKSFRDKDVYEFMQYIEKQAKAYEFNLPNRGYDIYAFAKDILYWLEKQGSEPNWCHHKVDLSDCSEEYRKAYYDGWNNCNKQHSQCKSELDDVVKCLINGMKFYYEGNEEALWGTNKWSMSVKHIIEVLEKQGEQKETLCDKCRKAQPSHSCQDITALGRCAVEHEQKSDNMVEPKFKVGDWITNGDYTWKIVEIKPLDYILQSQDGNIVDDTISHVDEEFNLWTIQDAKEGDVLHSTGFHSDCIFIFDGLDNWKFDEPDGERAVATGYCCLTLSADNMEFGIQGPDCIEVDTVKPATKIQRDLLFQKIKEAGYEWDAKKKDIEERHITNVG